MTQPDPQSQANAQDERRVRNVELLISTILRVGVVTSLLIIVLGTVVSFVHHPEYVRSPAELQRLTRQGVAFPHTPAQVAEGLRQGQGQAVVVVGLLLLIATPVARVAVSILAFVYQKDWVFVGITTIVLALLLLSFLLGRVER